MNNATKKLQKMINRRKISVVVSKQKDFKKYKRNRGGSTESNYYPVGFDNN
jgi:hypothetical protein